MRNEIFRYIREGEELVREPLRRLIEKKLCSLTNTPDSGSVWIPSKTSTVLMN